MTLALVLKYWKDAAVVILAAWVFGLCAARDRGLVAKGQAKEKVRVADSTIAVVTPKLARIDTLLVHDTVRVKIAIGRAAVIHDTVLSHLTDTVLVKEYVARADTALKACTELSNDCAAFRLYATQKITALESKAGAAPTIQVKSCVAPSLVWGTIGVAAGYVAHRR